MLLTSADVLLLEEGVGGESEGDLPREFSVGSWETVDDTASRSLQPALLECQSCGHQGGQYDQNLHFPCLLVL